MRHKVVEKPTERGLEREQKCGGGEPPRSKSPLSVSYHPRRSKLQSRGWAEQIATPRRRGVQKVGQAGYIEGDVAPRQGWWIVIRRTNSISRNASCLVLLKNSQSPILVFFICEMKYNFGKMFLVFKFYDRVLPVLYIKRRDMCKKNNNFYK